MVAAEAKGKGEGQGQGQRAMVRRRADLLNIADVMAGVDVRSGESVVDNILLVSEDEGEGAGRMAVEGGSGQPTAPNVPVAAMKFILPEVRRQGEGKGGQGQRQREQQGAGTAVYAPEGGDGQAREGKGRRGPCCALTAMLQQFKAILHKKSTAEDESFNH